jgi:hypothetical protein
MNQIKQIGRVGVQNKLKQLNVPIVGVNYAQNK